MRTCETLAQWWDGRKVKVTTTRYDEPCPEDGCQVQATISIWQEPEWVALGSVDLTQTLCRMMEAEIACQSKSYLLACERAGCQPCWSPPAGGPGDPEPEVAVTSPDPFLINTIRVLTEEISHLRREMQRARGDLS